MKNFLANLLKRPAVWRAVGIALIGAGVATQYTELLELIGPEIVDAALQTNEGAE